VHKISIIPRGIGALGYTIQRPTEDRFLMSREELENKMAVLLGGRAAEHIIYGRLSTGAADDLVKVTDIARSMVMRYGMEKKLGNLSYQEDPSPFLPTYAGPPAERRFSEETAKEIDRAVREISGRAFASARSLLSRKRNILEEGARKLLEKETLSETDIAVLAGSLVREGASGSDTE
jgi:cell division protease FtsH